MNSGCQISVYDGSVPGLFCFCRRDITQSFRREYNHERTHSSLNDMTPAEFIRSLRKDEAL
ncbi:integrase core domain-containing protein [Salmonella enterica]|uniref:integrase core domain-containing protein n=1 Tax=Salmonella enterica TaxID=28901 RepID=UPI0039AECD87